MAEQPGVESVVRLAERSNRTFRLPNSERKVEVDLVATESEFFSVFSFPLLSGPASGVLDGPANIVLTPTTATALFGEDDPIGQTVEYLQRDRGADSEWLPLVVTGIAASAPPHSSIQFDAVARFEVLNSRLMAIRRRGIRSGSRRTLGWLLEPT